MQAVPSRCQPRRKGQRYDKHMPMFGLSNFPSPEDLAKHGQLCFIGVVDGWNSFGGPTMFNIFELQTPTHIIPCMQQLCAVSAYTPAMAGTFGPYIIVQDLSRKVVTL